MNLESELAILENRYQIILEESADRMFRIEKLRTELAKARGTLAFYADKENWDDDFTPTVWDDGKVDLGNKAREALRSIDESGVLK